MFKLIRFVWGLIKFIFSFVRIAAIVAATLFGFLCLLGKATS